jgi:hypothetical protein
MTWSSYPEPWPASEKHNVIARAVDAAAVYAAGRAVLGALLKARGIPTGRPRAKTVDLQGPGHLGGTPNAQRLFQACDPS